MDEVIKLLPCPFCGCEAEMSGQDGSRSWWADCLNTKCEAEGPAKMSEAEAIEAWNTRIKDQSHGG